LVTWTGADELPFAAPPSSISATDRKGLVQNLLDDIESNSFSKQGQSSPPLSAFFGLWLFSSPVCGGNHTTAIAAVDYHLSHYSIWACAIYRCPRPDILAIALGCLKQLTPR